MTYGVQIFSASGALTWDSSTAGGGVVADVRTVAAGATAVWTYPAFAGRVGRVFSAFYLGLDPSVVDHDLGYPRVTVSISIYTRTLMVVVE